MQILTNFAAMYPIGHTYIGGSRTGGRAALATILSIRSTICSRDAYEYPTVVSGCSRDTYFAQLEHLESKYREPKVDLGTAVVAGEIGMPAVADCK
jgi:hypothetical protein